jgi:hypothetical protein
MVRSMKSFDPVSKVAALAAEMPSKPLTVRDGKRESVTCGECADLDYSGDGSGECSARAARVRETRRSVNHSAAAASSLKDRI